MKEQKKREGVADEKGWEGKFMAACWWNLMKEPKKKGGGGVAEERGQIISLKSAIKVSINYSSNL